LFKKIVIILHNIIRDDYVLVLYNDFFFYTYYIDHSMCFDFVNSFSKPYKTFEGTYEYIREYTGCDACNPHFNKIFLKSYKSIYKPIYKINYTINLNWFSQHQIKKIFYYEVC
jgi:hypothetical protein